MKTKEKSSDFPRLAPSANSLLFGHEREEAALRQMVDSGRLPQALMLCGPQGIGKATMGYRLARYILAGKQSQPQDGVGGLNLFGEPEQQPSETLQLDETNATFRRIAANSHADFMVISIEQSEKSGREIGVDQARTVSEFLSLTPAESDWRVVLVDAADELNGNAANALLKVLEEPPARSIIIMIAHQPGTLIPTIRSRCRHVWLKPLSPDQTRQTLAHAAPQIPEAEMEWLESIAQGSPGQALRLYEARALDGYSAILAQLEASRNPEEMLQFAESVSGRGKGDVSWQVWNWLWQFLLRRLMEHQHGLIQRYLTAQEKAALERAETIGPVAFWVDLWEKSQALLTDTDRLTLDRKQSALRVLQAANGQKLSA